LLVCKYNEISIAIRSIHTALTEKHDKYTLLKLMKCTYLNIVYNNLH